MKKLNLLISLLWLFLSGAPSALAQGIGINSGKQPGGIKVSAGDDPGALLGTVLKNTVGILFAVGAIGFTVMIIWGGVDWILSGGDKEKIAGARKRIVTAITGLVLLSLSFVIMVVIGQVLNIEFLQTGNFRIPTLYKP